MSTADTARLPPSAPIRRRLLAARWAMVGTELLRRASIVFAVVVALFLGLMAVDALFESPTGTRRFAIRALAVVLGAGILWTIAAFINARRRDAEIALAVEREFPEFDSRLISAVQFAEGDTSIAQGAPLAMAKASAQEAESIARQRSFLSVVDPRGPARAALAAVAVISVLGIWALVESSTLPVRVARAFGSDINLPRETSITDSPGEALIGIGDRIELAFTAEGILPDQGELSLRYASGRRETAPLAKDESAPGRYVASIEDVPESFSFRAKINDASTDPVEITALERPAVESIFATQAYPDFTGLAPSTHEPGDFALLPGSRITLSLDANKALSAASIGFVSGGEDVAIAIDGDKATAGFVVPEKPLGGFTVSLVDQNGLNSVGDTVYRVTRLVDRAPEIRITFPRRAEELATRRARVLLRYTATDRFGIASIALRYRRGESEPASLPTPIPEGAPKSIEGVFEWDLAQLTPPAEEGEVIEYWFDATDENTGRPAGEGVGRSEMLRIKVVSPEDKRADLLGRAGDTLGRVGETANEQQRLNDALKALIQEAAKPVE